MAMAGATGASGRIESKPLSSMRDSANAGVTALPARRVLASDGGNGRSGRHVGY